MKRTGDPGICCYKQCVFGVLGANALPLISHLKEESNWFIAYFIGLFTFSGTWIGPSFWQ